MIKEKRQQIVDRHETHCKSENTTASKKTADCQKIITDKSTKLDNHAKIPIEVNVDTAKSVSSSIKMKQKRKKEKRKLKILKRKNDVRDKNATRNTQQEDASEKMVQSDANVAVTSDNRRTKLDKDAKALAKISSAKSVNTSVKVKQKRKKEKRKLKILQRKKDNSNPKLEGGSKQMPVKSEGKRMCDIDEQGVSKKKRRKRLKKMEVTEDVESGASSGTETPHLPTSPWDVASNWKALQTKITVSGPSNRKRKTTSSWSENQNKRTKLSPEKSSGNDEIWFDDVDPALLEAEQMFPVKNTGNQDDKTDEIPGKTPHVMSDQITQCIALDCEMVGVGHQGTDSILARVSIVNQYGHCIYDKFVKPREKVTDYRTAVSGVRPTDVKEGEDFLVVQKEVADMMKNRILVGHALKNDMQVLYLGHPRKLIRDTASYKPFKELLKTKRPSLKKLAKTVLGVLVQQGEHSSVEDAQAAMKIYMLHRRAWEKSLKQRGKAPKKEK